MANRYFVERIKCPICASYHFIEFYRLSYLSTDLKGYLTDFYCSQGKIEFDYLENADYILCECYDCHSIFQKEIPNDELMHRLYEHWISPVNSLEEEKMMNLNQYKQYAGEILLITCLFDSYPTNLRFFDFGMGWGSWALMAKAFGIDPYGTELSFERIKHSMSNGINIISWEEIPNQNFDFINTEQVFEHIPEPLDTLYHLKSGLKKGGVIKISVPYASNIERRLKLMNWKAPKGTRYSLNPVAPLEHINYFRRESILKMASIAGLEEIKIPMIQQYANVTIWAGNLKQTVKDLVRPIYRYSNSNYIFLKY